MMDRVSNVWAWRTFSSYGGRGERWGQHIKKSKQHTNESHLLFTKGQTKGNKVPGDECLRTDKERGSGDECLRTDKEESTTSGQDKCRITDEVGGFISAWILMPYPPHPTRVTLRSASINEGKVNMIHCQDYAKRIHVECPMPYKSNIRSQRCLLKKVWVLFFFFCFVSISFAFYFLFDMLRREHLSFIVYLLLYLSFIVSFVFSIIGW